MKRGEVWSINLDPKVGAEIRRTRPAVILSIDAAGALPLRIVAPVTGWKAHFSDAAWLVRVEPDPANGLEKASAVDTFQMRSVSESRFVGQLGRLSGDDMRRVEDGAREILGL